MRTSILLFITMALSLMFISCSERGVHSAAPTGGPDRGQDQNTTTERVDSSTLPDTVTYRMMTNNTIRDGAYYVNGDKYTNCGSDTFEFTFIAKSPQLLRVWAIFNSSTRGRVEIEINDEVVRESIQPSDPGDPYFKAEAAYQLE